MNRKARRTDAVRRLLQTDDAGAPRSGRRPLLELREASRKLRVGDRDIKLTPNELRFVQLLRRHRGRAVSRDAVCAELWGRSGDSYYGRLEILVKRLRDKLGIERDLIQTERGSGYRLREAGLFNTSHIASDE
ncbi:MAG TPA: winged helix-turn-helix domain-containing protein [Polyangiaceae bacterium]